MKEETKNYEAMVTSISKKAGMVTKDDFNLISVIGTGAYGKVLLVRKKNSEQLYAMKVVKKKHIKKMK